MRDTGQFKVWLNTPQGEPFSPRELITTHALVSAGLLYFVGMFQLNPVRMGMLLCAFAAITLIFFDTRPFWRNRTNARAHKEEAGA